MNTKDKPSIQQLKDKLNYLLFKVELDPRVVAAKELVKKEFQIDQIKSQIDSLRKQIKPKKERFPPNTPKNVLDAAQQYWNGTTELYTFRIHCWNDKAFWTSWPSGGYTTYGGFVKTQATFFLVSLTIKETYSGRTRGKKLKELEGRVSLKTMQHELDNL